MRTFSLRRMTQGDVDGAFALLDRVADERQWIGTEPGYDRERYRANWSIWMNDPAYLLLVALDGTTVVGYLGALPNDEYGYVFGMFVDSTRRRQGIGKALLDATLAWAHERRLPAMHLLVFPHNEAAINLYRTAGFVEVERYERDVTRQDGSVWDTILMRKTLA